MAIARRVLKGRMVVDAPAVLRRYLEASDTRVLLQPASDPANPVPDERRVGLGPDAHVGLMLAKR